MDWASERERERNAERNAFEQRLAQVTRGWEARLNDTTRRLQSAMEQLTQAYG